MCKDLPVFQENLSWGIGSVLQLGENLKHLECIYSKLKWAYPVFFHQEIYIMI